ncbi:hypothetical protein NU50_004757, partial [Salmonella enterica subsp. salamae]|nr:hypothetical protein [Salmonella enterica subsp. salamae]
MINNNDWKELLKNGDISMSGKPAARQGDMTQVGGPIVQGSAGVLIGA